MTKQEYIKQQYGKAWDAVEAYVDENGWVINGPVPHSLGFNIVEGNGYGWRADNLRGIEGNNGWIKVEDRLPSCYMDVEVFDELHEQHTVVFNGERFQTNDSIICHITHWRPKIEYLKPLY